MRLNLRRVVSSDDASIGVLRVDGKFCCFCLEDEKRAVKVMHETRIPPGLYQIKLRTEGGMHEKYKGKYSDHRGMLWLQSVPGFEWVYIHVGNSDDDTSGCILVGDAVTVSFDLIQSVQAYRRLYSTVSNVIATGGQVEILIEDYDA